MDETESDIMVRSINTRTTRSSKGEMRAPDKLIRRGVLTERLPDPKIKKYEKLVMSQPELSLTDLQGLKSKLQRLKRMSELVRTPGVAIAQFYEELMTEFSNWGMGVRLPFTTREDFIKDVELCKRGSEHILQRTIMMTVVNRHHFHEWLAVDCEGKWKEEMHLPLMRSAPGVKDIDKIKLPSPKPDLAVSFASKAFEGPKEAIPFQTPCDLAYFINPDGASHRCFPFFFLEAKAWENPLEKADHRNLHSISQALYNIYQWLKRAEMKTEFFQHVRVFSLAMNLERFHIHVHRASKAIPAKQIEIEYFFDVVCEERIDGRKDYFCAIVRNILSDYAIRILHPILKKAYDAIVIPTLASSVPPSDEIVEAGPSQQLYGEDYIPQVVQDTEPEELDSDLQDDEEEAETTGTEVPQAKRKSGRGRPRGTTKKLRTTRKNKGQTQAVTDSFIEEVGNI